MDGRRGGGQLSCTVLFKEQLIVVCKSVSSISPAEHSDREESLSGRAPLGRDLPADSQRYLGTGCCEKCLNLNSCTKA